MAIDSPCNVGDLYSFHCLRVFTILYAYDDFWLSKHRISSCPWRNSTLFLLLRRSSRASRRCHWNEPCQWRREANMAWTITILASINQAKMSTNKSNGGACRIDDSPAEATINGVARYFQALYCAEAQACHIRMSQWRFKMARGKLYLHNMSTKLFIMSAASLNVPHSEMSASYVEAASTSPRSGAIRQSAGMICGRRRPTGGTHQGIAWCG